MQPTTLVGVNTNLEHIARVCYLLSYQPVAGLQTLRNDS